MSEVGRQRLWAREKAEASKPKKRLPRKRAGLPTWGVVKRYDNGTEVICRPGLTAFDAVQLAGKLRDLMSDDECAQDWNYQARKLVPRKLPPL